MGEGLGAGGHSTRRYCFNAEPSLQFLRLKLFSNLAPRREAPPARARPVRLVDRQFDVAAIRKLQISQTDAKTALPAAAALDHVARADREPAGETVCKGTHEYPRESNTTPGNFPAPNARTPRRFRDSPATVTDFCESLWTRSPCPERVRSAARAGGTNSITPRGLSDACCLTPRDRQPRSRGRSERVFTAFKGRSRCPAPRP